MRIFISFILWTSLLSAGCQANIVDAGVPFEITPSPIVEPVSPSSGESQMIPSLPPDAGLQNLINKAVADLAQRLSIPAAQINFLEAREVIWPDASMGCPQPEVVYAQVPVDGLLIRLGIGKEMYFYHSDGTADPFLCESTSPVILNVTPKTDEFVPPPDSEID